MLLSKEVELKWNSKIKNHYMYKDYEFTKMNNSFIAKVEDLTVGSAVRVEVQCDYCGKKYSMEWRDRAKRHKVIDKDCCTNKNCCKEKVREVNLKKYGHEWAASSKEVAKRRIDGCQIKYGVNNPFQSEEIKIKIVQTNMKRYGVAWSLQNKEIKEKAIQTTIKKYGVDNYSKTQEFIDRVSGENNPLWKGGVKYHRVERSTIEYRHWRKSVFDRDKYTCQCCLKKGGELRGHHINNWKDNEDLRYDINNGITLCLECHKEFHIRYGVKNNDLQQLKEFIVTHG